MMATTAMMPRTMGPIERFMWLSYPEMPASRGMWADDLWLHSPEVLRESPAEVVGLCFPTRKQDR
jgi:hypothetical protein